jgi:hypothetical protein
VVAESWFFLLFRPIHIITGALWFGSAFLFALFIGPAAAKVGPSAGPLLHVAIKERRAAAWITRLAVASVAAGWLMWLYHAQQTGLAAWWDFTEAKVLLLGGVIATVAMFEGWHGVGRNVERMVDVGDEMAAAGGPPPPERVAEMERIGAAIKKHSQIDLLLITLAVICMATARYW